MLSVEDAERDAAQQLGEVPLDTSPMKFAEWISMAWRFGTSISM